MKLLPMMILTAGALTLSACNESTREDALDVQASKTAIAKDNAAIDKHEDAIESERAAKASAKARGDYVGQAKHSVNIGAHQAIKGSKQVEKDVDKKILEEDQKDLAN